MITSIKFILIDFINFLRNKPTETEREKTSVLYYVFVYFLVYFVSMGLHLSIVIVYNILDVPYDPIPKSELLDTSNISFFIFGVILAPIIEELSFRYPLIYTRNSLVIGLAFFTISAFFTNRTTISGHHEISYFVQKLMSPRFLCFLFAIFSIYLITRIDKVNFFLSNIWDRYLIVIVYILAIYFAYLHFELPITAKNIIWIAPLIVPHFFFALYYSYIRLKLGFIYCILIHMTNNFIAFILTLISF